MNALEMRGQPPFFSLFFFWLELSLSVTIYLHFPLGDRECGWARLRLSSVLGSGRAADRLGVRQMPSAYHRSLMHEEDGDGQYPVPLEKRSQQVETAEERQHELKLKEDAKDRRKTSRREGRSKKYRVMKKNCEYLRSPWMCVVEVLDSHKHKLESPTYWLHLEQTVLW